MSELRFEYVTPEVESSTFDCGNNSINEYITESYYPLVTQQAYTYKIYGRDVLLGYYQTLFREISLADFPCEISDYDACVKEGKLSALHIRFIAVDKCYQKNKIGTAILRTIIKNALDLSDNYPIRVITIDALTHLVNWYHEEGFKDMLKNSSGQNGVSVAMYYDCMRFADELESYLEMNQ